MPSTPYDLVKDEQDLRIPLHAEQAFFHGITFQAKVSDYKLFLYVDGRASLNFSSLITIINEWFKKRT